MDFKRVARIGIIGIAVVATISTIAGVVGAAAGVAVIRGLYNGPTERGDGVFVDLDSEILGHSVRLRLHRPVGLDEASPDTIHVLWALDGPSRAPRASSASDDLTRVGRIPPTVVVEVPESAAGRTADFVPPGLSVSGIDGRGDHFLRFLVEEARPAVYDALGSPVGRHLLVGHSLGGLFVTYAMMTEPTLFDGWLAFSPSWWVDDGSQVQALDGWLAAQQGLDTFFYTTLGSEEGSSMRSGFESAREAMRSDVPDGFRWVAEVIPGAHHGNNADLSVARALDAFWQGASDR